MNQRILAFLRADRFLLHIVLLAVILRLVVVYLLYTPYPPTEFNPIMTEIGWIGFSIATGQGFSSP
ncbi:MAG TPA: hypothetical protein VGA40_05500, partial [Candidatus Acidoferrales bacterium]